jgi:hypothetical protein
LIRKNLLRKLYEKCLQKMRICEPQDSLEKSILGKASKRSKGLKDAHCIRITASEGRAVRGKENTQ